MVNVHSTSYARDFFGFVEPQEGSGSGSVIDQEGNILTNYHVIEGATKLAVSFGGQKNYAAQLVGGDPDTDLAVIRLIEKPKEPLTVIALGDSDKLEVGQKVLAIGNPFGLDRTLTTGVISGLQRPIRARNGAAHRGRDPNRRLNQSGKLRRSIARLARPHDRNQLANSFAIGRFSRGGFRGAGKHCETHRAAVGAFRRSAPAQTGNQQSRC